MLKVWILSVLIGSYQSGGTKVVTYNYPTQQECLKAASIYKREFNKSGSVSSVGTVCQQGYIR